MIISWSPSAKQLCSTYTLTLFLFGFLIFEGALDDEAVNATKQGVENDRSRATADDRNSLSLEVGTEHNRLRHLGAPASANNEEKRQGKKRKQQSLASEKDDISGGGASSAQRSYYYDRHDDASGASSDAAAATVYGMRSMISVPPHDGIPYQPPSFGSHFLFDGVDRSSSSLALRLAEIRAAQQTYQEVVNSLHARTTGISSWPFHPSASVFSMGHPSIIDRGSGLPTTGLTRTTTNDISMLPWLGATAAGGISSRGLLLTSQLSSNPLISPVLRQEDFGPSRKTIIPPGIEVVSNATTPPLGPLFSPPNDDIHTGGRSDGVTMLREERSMLHGLAATRLERKRSIVGSTERTPGVEGPPLSSLHHRPLLPVAHDDHQSSAPKPSGPLLDSTDGRKMSDELVHGDKEDGGVVAEGQRDLEGGGSGNKGSTHSKRSDEGTTNSEDPVVRAARLGTAVDRSQAQDDHQTSTVLYVDGDEHYLTEYQCLLRKQLEVFEAGPNDIRGSTQGRNVPILLGQVGLRCRHCANLPLAARTKGAVYYSQTIEGMYQIAQNMSKVHLCQRCYRIPPDIQQELISLKNECRRATGGKEYWTAALATMGVYEDGAILRMKKG